MGARILATARYLEIAYPKPADYFHRTFRRKVTGVFKASNFDAVHMAVVRLLPTFDFITAVATTPIDPDYFEYDFALPVTVPVHQFHPCFLVAGGTPIDTGWTDLSDFFRAGMAVCPVRIINP